MFKGPEVGKGRCERKGKGLGGEAGEGSGALESSRCFILRAEAMEELERWACLGTEALIAPLRNVSSGL